MTESWEEIGSKADEKARKWTGGAISHPWRTGAKIVGIVIVASLLLGGVAWLMSWADVAKQEFSPQAIKAKFEMFQGLKATMDEKMANIQIYVGRINSFINISGNNASAWDRFDKEDYQQMTSELTGLIQSYNNVCRDYNYKMSLWYVEMFNVGQEVDYHNYMTQYGLQNEYGEYQYTFPV